MQPIFLEKIRRPDPRGLARDRLEERLLATDCPPLGLVLGPPGSGKSTLLGRVAARSVAPGAWYRVSEEDGTEESLVRHLARAVANARPGEAETLTAAGSVAALVAALEARGPSPVLVVVDDLHEIAGTPAERAFERFVALRPRHVRILLGSRRPPALNLSRLLVSGELSQLDSDDLRFRSWEVEELFRTVYSQPLSPETAAALTRRTGGWAAGLQLFHLATAGLNRPDRERAVDELSGRSRLIRSYLARNVLDGLAPARREFLVRTCTLGVLTGELCDALLDTSGSAAVLAELEQEQFFTTSTDGGETYHYHQVLQTHLEIVLNDQLGQRGAREVYAASARLLEQSGRTAAAVRAHARADDWGAVARLLHHTSPALSAVDDAAWIASRWPGVPSDDPSLVLAGARRLLRNGLVAEAVAAFAHAESLTDDPDFSARCADQRQQAAGWLPRAGDRTGAAGSRAHRLSVELRQATRSVHDPGAFGLPLSRAIAYLFAGDTVGAAKALEPVLADPRLPVWERLVVRLVLQISDLRRWSIAPGTAARLEEIILTADVEGLPWVSRVARGLQAAMHLASQPTPWRLAAGTELLEDCERHGDQWTLCVLATVLGAAHAFAGQTEPALAPLRRAEEVADELGAPVLQVWATAFRTAVLLRTGDRGARADAPEVARWARALGANGAARLLEPGGLETGLGVQPAAQTVPAPIGSAPTDPGPPRLELHLLGGFELRVGAQPHLMTELRPRARSVLMMLALHHGHDVHRERLVDALWPDATLAGGVRSLQVAVSSIRQWLAAAGLAEQALSRHGDGYALSLPIAAVDLRDFEQLVIDGERLRAGDRAAALVAKLSALDRYVGWLLPEAGPAEWVVDERDRLQTLAARVGAEAAQLGLELGELTDSRRAAQRSVELDPYHDLAWRALAAAHERLGDRSAAAITRREHGRLLAELGLNAPREAEVSG